LDNDFVKTSGYILRTEIGKAWKFQIKSKNAETFSNYTTMGGGTYDPDHNVGTSNTVSYSADFEFNLPYLTSTAAVSLDSSPLGFNVNIEGDAWKDTADEQNNAHEYEVIYSNSSNPSFNDFSDVFHLYTQNTTVPISSNIPAKWYVKVRAIQNKQAVSSGLYTNVVGGGGGIPAGDQVIVTTQCNLVVSSGTVASTDTSQTNTFTGLSENIITLDNIYDAGLGLDMDFGSFTLQDSVIVIGTDPDPTIGLVMNNKKIKQNITKH